MEQTAEGRNGEGGQGRPALTREEGHAFKNIFSIILANAELIQEESRAAAPFQRRLERITEAARRGEELVRRLRNADAGETPCLRTPAPEPRWQGNGPVQVLVVDDEDDVVEIICRFLRKAEVRVQGTTDPRLALEMVRSHPGDFGLVITDMDMPYLSGAQLCRSIQSLRPELPIMVITGYDRQAGDLPDLGMGIRELLVKPINREQLLASVRRLLPP